MVAFTNLTSVSLHFLFNPTKKEYTGTIQQSSAAGLPCQYALPRSLSLGPAALTASAKLHFTTTTFSVSCGVKTMNLRV